MEITKLVLEPESKTLEFKQDLSSLSPVLKTIVAFANTAGGTLIIGRSADGKICGVPDPFAAEERLASAIADNIRPSLFPEIEIATIDGRDLVIIQVAHWKGPFYLKKRGIPTGVYVRLGSTSRPVNPDTLAEMQRQATHASYDQESLVELNDTDLDIDLAKESFRKKGKSLDKQKMTSCGLLSAFDHRLVPTIGGLILFGYEEQRMRYVPDARVSCARFRGINKTHIIDRLEITDTILQAVEPTLNFIVRNTRLGAHITAKQRIDIPEYPPLAIREALINSLVHADYTVKGSHTRVSIFDDRLELLNSGMLPFGYTLADFTKGISRVRNRVIARTFRELDLMEEWGSGYRRIISECDEKGYPHPVWSETGTWILVTFYPHPMTLPTGQPLDGRASFRQEKIVNIVTMQGPISTHEIREKLSESIAPRTLSRELAHLRDLGLIVRTGKGPAIRWTAPD